MAPSSCIIAGIFSLSGGTRSTDPNYYATYLSALEFANDEKFINVSIRKYSASGDALFTDGSFVFMIAKAALPAGQDGLLDSLHCTSFASSSEDPEACRPSVPTHVGFVTGTVSATDDDGTIRSFTLAVAEYVRDERRTFNIRFEFNGKSNRWKNLRLPAIGSMVVAMGTFQDISRGGNGEPVLTLLDVSLGLPKTPAASPSRPVGHRKTARTPVELDPIPSFPASQPAAASTSVQEQVPNTKRTTNKRAKEAEEGDTEDPPKSNKRTRIQRGKANAPTSA